LTAGSFFSFNFKTQELKSLAAAGKIPVCIEVVFIASGLQILILPSESNNIRAQKYETQFLNHHIHIEQFSFG
jgi:hypothetical protein